MNNTMENTFDEVFKDKLGEVSVAPSPQVWENMKTLLEVLLFNLVMAGGNMILIIEKMLVNMILLQLGLMEDTQ